MALDLNNIENLTIEEFREITQEVYENLSEEDQQRVMLRQEELTQQGQRQAQEQPQTRPEQQQRQGREAMSEQAQGNRSRVQRTGDWAKALLGRTFNNTVSLAAGAVGVHLIPQIPTLSAKIHDIGSNLNIAPIPVVVLAGAAYVFRDNIAKIAKTITKPFETGPMIVGAGIAAVSMAYQANAGDEFNFQALGNDNNVIVQEPVAQDTPKFDNFKLG